MANLNFKWGPYANLKNAAPQAGTIYITTDEQSMYVDLKKEIKQDDGTKKEEVVRARIQGSVLYYDSVETFTKTTTPPYSTETLYFFRKINAGDNAATNALMAYDGKDWKQINITKEQFEAQGASITALVGDVTQLSTDLTNLTTRVTALEGYVGVPAEGSNEVTGMLKDIADLKTAVGTGVSGESLGERVAAIEEYIGEPAEGATPATGLRGTISILETGIADLGTNKADKSDLNNYVKTEDYNKDKTTINNTIASKVDQNDYDTDKAALQTTLASKANTTYVDNEISELNTNIRADITTGLAEKANVSELEK